MKQSSKNEAELLDLIYKIQEQISILDKKIDSLVNRHVPVVKPAPMPALNVPRPPNNEHNKGRMKFTAICADCKQECTIPFKPSGDRPVYCQNCFSRRKVISMSGVKFNEKSNEPIPLKTIESKVVDVPKQIVKTKKKIPAAKKTAIKKKATPKKK